ncbi:prolyl oligopeptidase family serine peptidase [Amycolatopsis thailandensis]|uniref:prolyl oligopeptidase family serine peptidase n=1 Tax=Amycolatopsis thailandensis TaxID=589330 RepID=UPI00364284A5
MHAEPVEKNIGGVAFVDRFAHLEKDTTEVLEWQEELNRSARETAHASPNFVPVRDRLRQLSDLPQGHLDLTTLTPCKRGDFWFEFGGKGNAKFLRMSEAVNGPWRTVLSAASIAETTGQDGVSIDLFNFTPSPSGRFVAVGWLIDGAQAGTVSVYETGGNEHIVDVDALLYSEALPAWLPDESGFWMNGRNEEGLHSLRFVPVAEDAHERADVILPEELTGTVHAGLTLQISPDARRAVAVTEPHEHIALIHLDLETLEATPFLPEGWSGDCDGGWIDNETYVARENGSAPRGRAVAIPVATSRDTSTWRELVPEGDGFMVWAGVVSERLYVGDLVDVSSRVRSFELDGTLVETFPLETPGSVPSLNYQRAIRLTDVLTFTHETFTSSESFVLHDPKTGKLERFRESAHRLDDVVAEQRFATSHDGVRVPYFMIHKKALDLSKPQPTLVYAYGGFNTAVLPEFPTVFVPFIEAGGIFVQASLRGGSEYGRAWHDGGRQENKVNTFRDLEAVVETLITDGVTTSELSAFHGLSNGGLTAGSAIVFQPHLWRVVVPMVALYDMLEPMPVVPENAWIRAIFQEDWGNPEEPEIARRTFAWSPYHNIKDDVAYPAVFQVFGAEDTACKPFHGRKFTARLGEASSSGHPIHLRVWPDTGHQPSVQADEYGAEWLAFVMDQLGMTASGPAA